MWFWLFVAVILTMLTAGTIQRFFWWSIAGTTIVWTIGIIVEMHAMREQQQADVDPPDTQLSAEAPRAVESGKDVVQRPVAHRPS
jgi:hypothetical protein